MLKYSETLAVKFEMPTSTILVNHVKRKSQTKEIESSHDKDPRGMF